jgi:hypothetical protein
MFTEGTSKIYFLIGKVTVPVEWLKRRKINIEKNI